MQYFVKNFIEYRVNSKVIAVKKVKILLSREISLLLI